MDGSPYNDAFPVLVEGKVVHGFGRGSKQLGCPTANLESDVVDTVTLPNGIYYGFAQLETNQASGAQSQSPVLMMCCSFGFNPQFNNEKKSLEVHLLKDFGDDFYGATLRVAICGHIRSEKKFFSIDELKEAIWADIAYTRRVLDEEQKFQEVRGSHFFKTPS